VLSLQSIPPPFAPTLSTYLNLRSRFEVQAFIEKAPLNPGRCYIANCGQEMQFAISDGRLVLHNYHGEPGNSSEQNIDRLLFSASELFQERVAVMLLSGAELGSLEGLRAVQANGGAILMPEPERCILPASIEPALEMGLVTERFDPAELPAVLMRYCR
jgi:two-component system chemotaxis response regulator CheB